MSGADGNQSVFGSMVGRRRCACYVVSIVLVASVLGIYHTCFKRPSNVELMKLNTRSKTSSLHSNSGTGSSVVEVDDDTVDGGQDRGDAIWKEFLERNKFVSIGDVWDRDCDDEGRQTIGTVVLIPDKENGGLKTRTFMNYTLHEDVTGGEFYIDVKYNHKDLFDNHWELCSFEDDLETDKRSIYCPIRHGEKSEIKDKDIPVYLPKGEYYTKSWIIDQEGRTVMCGTSNLIL